MPESWTILAVLEWTARRFAKAGLESPRLDAQVLLAHVLECERVQLYTSFDKPLAAEELAAYRGLIRQRLEGTPVAYLTGAKEFWSRVFKVDRRVLIPRGDSEALIEAILDRVDRAKPLEIIDVGTGSGALAITLACELPRSAVLAVDQSPEALEVAAENVERHGVGDRVELVAGDLLAPAGGRTFDVVVANLPYVAAGELAGLSAEVRSEPADALVSGADGLDHYRRLAGDVARHLCPGGLLAAEHGDQQGAAIRRLFESAGLARIETHRDLAGHERITVASRE